MHKFRSMLIENVENKLKLWHIYTLPANLRLYKCPTIRY